MASHENTGNREAHVRITVCFEDREPAGPYDMVVPARRTLHQRYHDLCEPQQIPVATNYPSVIESDVPVVVQDARLDSRQPENALLSTIVFPL